MTETRIYQLNLNEDELAILGAVMLVFAPSPILSDKGMQTVQNHYGKVLKLMERVAELVKATPEMQKFMAEHPEILGGSNVS